MGEPSNLAMDENKKSRRRIIAAWGDMQMCGSVCGCGVVLLAC